jgi:transposase
MEALERIGQLFAIEAEIRGKDPAERHAARQQRSRPLLDELRSFLERALSQISKKSMSIGMEPGPPIGVQKGPLCGVG